MRRVQENHLFYDGIPNWLCILDNCNLPEQLPSFCITSSKSISKQAYEESIKIAENIKYHLEHKAFLKEFNIR